MELKEHLSKNFGPTWKILLPIVLTNHMQHVMA